MGAINTILQTAIDAIEEVGKKMITGMMDIISKQILRLAL